MIKKALTPTAINKYIKSVLENNEHLKNVVIKGEVSNLKYHSSKNIYLSIKDEESLINCIIFKNYANKIDFQLKEGMKVEIVASIYGYLKMGQYTFTITSIKNSGVGNLYQQYLENRALLKKKGYFNPENKKKIPIFSSRVAVLTSDTGAALQDIYSTIKRRSKYLKITVIPTVVQGEYSESNIIKNLKYVQTLDSIDLIILGRGGGSIEDLWSFNSIDVCQTIFDCPIPIITGIGHETDITLADYVSDFRAHTPTAAAEIATQSHENFEIMIKEYPHKSYSILNRLILLKNQQLEILVHKRSFTQPLIEKEVLFDDLSQQLFTLNHTYNLKINNYQNNLSKFYLTFNVLINKMEFNNLQLSNSINLLSEMDPTKILTKGYSLVLDESNKVIKKNADLSNQKKITIRFHDGKSHLDINEISKDENEKQF